LHGGEACCLTDCRHSDRLLGDVAVIFQRINCTVCLQLAVIEIEFEKIGRGLSVAERDLLRLQTLIELRPSL